MIKVSHLEKMWIRGIQFMLICLITSGCKDRLSRAKGLIDNDLAPLTASAGSQFGSLFNSMSDSVFHLQSMHNRAIGEALKGVRLIIGVEATDCSTCIEECVNIMNSVRSDGYSLESIVLLLSGYSPREALVFKDSYGIPIEIYLIFFSISVTQDLNMPRLWSVDDDYNIKRAGFNCSSESEILRLLESNNSK